MLLLTLAAACLCGFISYQHGYKETVTEGRSSESSPKTRLRERPEADSDIGKPRSARLTMAEKTQRLRSLAGRMRSTNAIIESWEIIRDLGDNDIRDLIDQLKPQDKDTDQVSQENSQIPLLYFRWAQLDPTAALESADAHNDESAAESAFASWMKQDSTAAIRWAASSEKFKDSQTQADWMALNLVNLTPAEALAKATTYGEKTRAATLKLISQNQADTPEDREAFLSGIISGDLPETDKSAAMKAFFTSWGAHDSLKALDQLAGTPITPEQKSELRQNILRTWSRNDPEAALTWMIGKPDTLPDARQLSYFQYWSQGAPLRASDWLTRQSPEIRQKLKPTP